MTARPYRILPALAAFILFLAAGSLLVRGIMGGGAVMTPLQEMQCVQYAIAFPAQTPETLTPKVLEDLLGRLDERLRPIASRITIVSYSAASDDFHLKAVHAADPGRTYEVGLYGVR